MTAPAIALSDNVEEEDPILAVAEGLDDSICDADSLGGAKTGVASVVINSNLSNSNWLLPFVADWRFVTTAVWKVSGKRGVSKYTTSKIADPFDILEVILGGPPSIVNWTKFFPTPPATVPQTRNR